MTVLDGIDRCELCAGVDPAVRSPLADLLAPGQSRFAAIYSPSAFTHWREPPPRLDAAATTLTPPLKIDSLYRRLMTNWAQRADPPRSHSTWAGDFGPVTGLCSPQLSGQEHEQWPCESLTPPAVCPYLFR